MGYLKIQNLYRPESANIFLFKEVYALEKIHGTSAHIELNRGSPTIFFSGGEKHDKFVKLFDVPRLDELYNKLETPYGVCVYGEAYGGKCQGMSDTYGKELKFIAFDVQIGSHWLSVPNAEKLVLSLGLEFVDYKRVTTSMTDLDAERDKPSTQAVRAGIAEPKLREGIVIRPLVEMTLNNGARIISKHKRAEFSELKTPREVVTDPAKLILLEDAEEIAEQFVTPMRLKHVMDKLPSRSVESIPEILCVLLADIELECKGELVVTAQARKAINKKAVAIYKSLRSTHLPTD